MNLREKHPLFKTTDGYEIYDGDGYYFISWNGDICGMIACQIYFYQYNDKTIRFKYEKAAKVYMIFQNLAKFSTPEDLGKALQSINEQCGEVSDNK